MHPRVGLEMNELGALIVTYECARCRETQRRAFRLTKPGDTVTCGCEATATLSPAAYEKLTTQVGVLRAALEKLDTKFDLRL